MEDLLINDVESRKDDALDKLRTETMRHLRKYSRRIKAVGEEQVRKAFAENPNADPEVVADEALAVASAGSFLTAQQPTPAVTASAADDSE